MAVKIDAASMAATWVVESEQAGVPALVGLPVRIEVHQVNPMFRRPVITPAKGSSANDFNGLFAKMKPGVVMIVNDKLLCSMGIIARKQP